MCTETLDLPSVPEPAELQRAPGAADSSQPRRSAPPDTYRSATNPMSRAGEPAVRIGSILHRARCKSRRFPKENEVEIQQTAAENRVWRCCLRAKVRIRSNGARVSKLHDAIQPGASPA